jgi:hypothetical protein
VKVQLHRYASAVPEHRLAGLLARPGAIPWEPLGLTVDLAEIRRVSQELVRDVSDRPSWDRELVKPVHQALQGLSRRDAADLRFWHWFSVNALPEFVWERWHGSVPSAEEIPLVLGQSRSLTGRFLGGNSLEGTSRNTFARLWWCAETLSDGGTDYSLAQQALRSQDLFQAIFERQFGLYPPAARACVKVLGNGKQSEWRSKTRKLNNVLTTIVAEALDEEDIKQLLV